MRKVFYNVGLSDKLSEEEIEAQKKVFAEERLAYFIEDYVNMDAIMEKFAWRSPDLLRKNSKSSRWH